MTPPVLSVLRNHWALTPLLDLRYCNKLLVCSDGFFQRHYDYSVSLPFNTFSLLPYYHATYSSAYTPIFLLFILTIFIFFLILFLWCLIDVFSGLGTDVPVDLV